MTNHDSWAIGSANPIRWKSHYYDTETNFYYIGGRYYDPEVGQFFDTSNVEMVLSNCTRLYGLLNGGGAIRVGISLMSLSGPIGIAGGILTLIGAVTMAFGANEIAYGIIGDFCVG